MSEKTRTALVALNRPLAPFSYQVPDALVAEVVVGALVEVPLANGAEIGCVVELDPPDFSDALFKLKPILKRVSTEYLISEEVIRLCEWISRYYFCSLGEALATASMLGFSHVEQSRIKTWEPSSNWEELELSTRHREILSLLSDGCDGPLTLTALSKIGECSPSTLKKILEFGALRESVSSPRIPPPDEPPGLLPEQVEALGQIDGALSPPQFRTFLLHGVTGSGKTEVYLRLIQQVLEAGKTALCLVPEISLTPQTVDRFARRFQQPIGIFHSQTTRREKLQLYKQIASGEIRMVIGARSAAFSPLPNLGIIIIDEEHEGSYKQSESPRYHARDVAIVRAQKLGIPVVMGSATPSFESYENAISGKYTLLKLTSRPLGLEMPRVGLVHLGKAAAEDPTGLTMISTDLQTAIRDRLKKGEQTLLFLNRRGFSNFLFCPSCRWVARCDEDDITLTIHRRRDKKAHSDLREQEELELFPGPLKRSDAWLKCHFCGRTHDYPKQCPKCGEEGIAAVGTGTQRIEEALRRLFPDENILRLDRDTISGRRGFLEAWHKMMSGEAQIILGTQMIAKGLHLERVSLVGVILADIGLFIPDFRAEERTFSLLMQVSGRAGRTNLGEVMVQTYMPHHAAVQLAAAHNYEAFFEVEMRRRRQLRFPPVERLIAITISDPDRQRAISAARQLGSLLRRYGNRSEFSSPVTLGPQPAPVERLANRFRQRLLIRGRSAKVNAELLRAVLASAEWTPASSLRVTIDVDPLDML